LSTLGASDTRKMEGNCRISKRGQTTTTSGC